MNKIKTLTMYFALGMVTLVMLFAIFHTEKKLDRMVADHHLRFTGNIQNAPPLVAFTTVALGSFRGLIADFLWLRAGGLQEKGNYFEMVQLARWITDLQPTFSGATAYLAWNMAYNISVTCSDFEDRWRWVNEGIKLIRDRAIEYNPEDPVLYKELAWIYQHKMGNMMDDANLYYKNKQAILMTSYLGAKPDLAAMAAAPANNRDFQKTYAADHPLWAAMAETGIKDLEQLYAGYRSNDNNLLPELTAKLKDPALAAKLDDFLRAESLRRELKMDPAVMVEIDRKYGKLDWRISESQAIYWATMGLKKTPGGRDLNCERLITQSLYESFRSGRLLMIDPKNFESIISVPNLELVDTVKSTYEETYEKNDRQNSFYSAKINFMKDAVTILFNYGKFAKAEEYFQELRKTEGDARESRNLEDFVLKRWEENIRDATPKKANDAIAGLIFRSLFYLVYGDNDAALANERIARYIYNNYMKKAEGQQFRVGLMPYTEIKKAVTENCLKTFPPAMAAILRGKLAQDAAAATQEK
jgi:hypothetical protein